MSNRDTGIRNLIPGYRDPEEIKEDENTRRYVETVVNRSPRVTPEPLGETLVRTTPSLNLELKPKDSTKEPKSFISEKEYENHLVSRPTRAESKGAYNNFVSNQKTINQLKALKEWAQPTPVGLGNNYKSDLRTPVQKKRDSYNAKVDANRTKTEEAKKGGYTPWYERLAAEKKEKEEEDPRTEGRMEELQKIDDEGKSWFSKHLKKSQ